MKTYLQTMERCVGVFMILAMVAALGIGCNVEYATDMGDSQSVVASTGTLEVRVHDKPLENVAAIMITVDQVEIHKAVADSVAASTQTDDVETDAVVEESDESDTGGWISLNISGENPFDLLALQGGIHNKLAMVELDTGKYTQIRMTISDISLEMNNDDEAPDVKLPSGKLKFTKPFEVREGELTVLDMDFIAEKAVVLTGNSRAIFKPVIKLDVDYLPCADMDQDADGVNGCEDCNDNDAGIGQALTGYLDNDGDGYGSGEPRRFCEDDLPSGYVNNNTDCDDSDNSVSTGQTWYRDSDDDGYGDATNSLVDCVQPDGYVSDSTDCDDGNELINPGATEVCNDSFDNDCDTLTDCADSDCISDSSCPI